LCSLAILASALARNEGCCVTQAIKCLLLCLLDSATRNTSALTDLVALVTAATGATSAIGTNTSTTGPGLGLVLANFLGNVRPLVASLEVVGERCRCPTN